LFPCGLVGYVDRPPGLDYLEEQHRRCLLEVHQVQPLGSKGLGDLIPELPGRLLLREQSEIYVVGPSPADIVGLRQRAEEAGGNAFSLEDGFARRGGETRGRCSSADGVSPSTEPVVS
jgi:hypothetical protein